jgi:serine/threonine protein kinase
MANVPEFVGRYRIERTLGQGRLGVLFLATDPMLDREVAVRIVPSVPDPDSFEPRLRSIGRLRHRGLAPIFDVGTHEGLHYIVREYVKGQALAEIISLKARIPLADRLAWMVTIGEVLAYAHRKGVAGLRLEPADVIVGRQGEAHIVDLGLRSLVESAGADTDPSYLSPETLAGGPVDPRSDIFAAGVLLYELVTYQRPFGRWPADDIRKRIADGAHWIPHDDLNGELTRIVARAIAARYQTVEELLIDLRLLRTRRQVDTDVLSIPSEPSSSLASDVDPAPESEIDDLLGELVRAERPIEEVQIALSVDVERPVDDEPAAAGEPPRRVDDNVRFTVYRPPAMVPQRWYPLLIFAHLGERRPDAPPEEPDPIEQVESTARTVLGPAGSRFRRIIQDASASIPHEALLKIVPSVPGVTFNPPEFSFFWTESVHKAEFRISASASLQGRSARGAIDVWMGAICVARITIAIPIDASAVDPKPPVADVFQPYRRIFASYSHKDTAIVRQFENYARAIGDSYMRDVIDLRAGEHWNDRLLELIGAADVFQLFWSSNSMRSPFVRREWEHALTVDRANFVRPLYWESPLPERDGLPPPALKARHFASVAVAGVSTTDERELRLDLDLDEVTVVVPRASASRAPRVPTAPRIDHPANMPSPAARRHTLMALMIMAILLSLLGLLFMRC